MSADKEQDPKPYAIIGAAMEVHRRYGHGFLEPIYQECFEIELQFRNVAFAREVLLALHYRERELRCKYKVDFICYNSVLVELKALEKLTNRETAQVINYMKATGIKRSLLINFGAPQLEFKRLVLNL